MTTTGYRFTHNSQYAGYSDQVVQSPRSGGIAGDCPIRDLLAVIRNHLRSDIR